METTNDPVRLPARLWPCPRCLACLGTEVAYLEATDLAGHVTLAGCQEGFLPGHEQEDAEGRPRDHTPDYIVRAARIDCALEVYMGFALCGLRAGEPREPITVGRLEEVLVSAAKSLVPASVHGVIVRDVQAARIGYSCPACMEDDTIYWHDVAVFRGDQSQKGRDDAD